ncbi:MAG: hypothetical protein M1816_001360 [Peltula sp. TS41687]|nr:MAG: hypothetical protein M1816_001360 [Peltula sp. TS41687]
MSVQHAAGSSTTSYAPSRPPQNHSVARSPSRSVLEKGKRQRPVVVLDIPLGQAARARESLQLSSPDTTTTTTALAALPLSSTFTLSHVGRSPSITSSPRPFVKASIGPDDYFGSAWKGSGGAGRKSPQKQASPARAAPPLKANSALTPRWLSRKASADDFRPLLGSSGVVGAYRSEMSPSAGEVGRRIDKIRRGDYENSAMGQDGGRYPRRDNANHSPSGGKLQERDREKGYRQPSQKAMLGKALEQANAAVLLDNAHNFVGAMDAYGDACALLQQVMMRSSDDEDRRKLDDVRKSYKNRIDELRNAPAQERIAEKALPAPPGSSPVQERGSSHSLAGEIEESPVLETATAKRLTNGDFGRSERQTLAPMKIPTRRESLMPSPLDDVEQFFFSTSPLKKTWTGSSDPEEVGPSSFEFRVDMEREYMPPPLSPRRPSSPVISESPAKGGSVRAGSVLNPGGLQPPGQNRHSRGDSTGSISWLDTIEESGGSSASSIHSRSSSIKARPSSARPVSGDTEAEFDAALDAAVEAACNQGLEPVETEMADEIDFDLDMSSDGTRNNALMERSVEREPAMLHRNEGDTHPFTGYTNHDRNGRLKLGGATHERDDDELLLEEVTREFAMEEFEFDSQSKSALPRQSDSSGFSGRTWKSSIDSNPTTAGTSLQTLPELSTVPPGLRLKTSPQPPLPPPSGALPPAPPTNSTFSSSTPSTSSGAHSKPSNAIDQPGQGVRSRRLSRQSHDSLTIDVGGKYAPGEHTLQTLPTPILESTALERVIVPPPPKTTSAIPERHQNEGSPSESEPTPVPQGGATRKISSPFPGSNFSTAPPGLLRYLPVDHDSAILPSSRAGSPSQLHASLQQVESRSVRKNLSSSSLKNRNLSISSPDGSDLSPITPTNWTFPGAHANVRKSPMSSAPPLPTSTVTNANVSPGGLHLFENDIHSQVSPGIPIPLAQNAPVPLEPCPTETILRPFWLMRCLYQTIAHPSGGYLSRKLFVPRQVWHVKGVKIKAMDEKISNCDFLTAALLKLAKVDTCDADAVLEEMQSLEHVLDQVQSTLSKKLGSDVGPQGTSMWLRDSPIGSEQSSIAESGSSKPTSTSNRSYLSLKRLKLKNSSAGLSSLLPASKDVAKDNASLSSLPMTSSFSTRTAKRDVDQIQFTGPNAVYMNALARLFDAAQVLDQISRQADDPGLKHSSQTHVGLELSARHAAEFFALWVCRFVITDISMMLDKYIKRNSEWVLV